MARLTAGELETFLAEHRGWRTSGDAIVKEFSFRGFRDSIAFVNRTADLANAAGHHPDLEIHYDRVLVSLSTHDEGGVTERDTALAAQIDDDVDHDSG